MQLLFKQRLFSWFDSYDIYGEDGKTLFTVKGVLAWGHELRIYDSEGRELGKIKEEILTFTPRFMMYVNEKSVGEIKKEITFFHPKYVLDCNGWEVNGDILNWNYQVNEGNRLVMRATKQFALSDTYLIDVANPNDMLYSLMIVLAIDAIQCSNND